MQFSLKRLMLAVACIAMACGGVRMVCGVFNTPFIQTTLGNLLVVLACVGPGMTAGILFRRASIGAAISLLLLFVVIWLGLHRAFV
jgi:hypothetical protein